MEKEINYYTFAEDDYLFLKMNVDEGRVSNAMTSIAQNICERYLKHIIDVFCIDIDCTGILKTNSLKRIFIRQPKRFQYFFLNRCNDMVQPIDLWRGARCLTPSPFPILTALGRV